MLAVAAFSSIGFLIGAIVALSEDHLARVAVPLLFSLFGGSIIAFGRQLSGPEKKDSHIALLSISLGCVGGILVGILCTQYRWLSPTLETAKGTQSASSNGFYLRGITISTINGIDQQFRAQHLLPEEAYNQLLAAIRKEQTQEEGK